MDTFKLKDEQFNILYSFLIKKYHLQVFRFISSAIAAILFLVFLLGGLLYFQDVFYEDVKYIMISIIFFITVIPTAILFVALPFIKVYSFYRFLFSLKNDNYKLYHFSPDKIGYSSVKDGFKHFIYFSGIYLDEKNSTIDVLFMDYTKKTMFLTTSSYSIKAKPLFLLEINKHYLCFAENE